MNYFKSSIILIFLASLFYSCSEDDNMNAGIDENIMSATINGISYNMDSKTTVFKLSRTIGPSGLVELDILAMSDAGNIRIIIPSYTGKNIYLMGMGTLLLNSFEFESSSPLDKWVCKNPGTTESDRNYFEVISDDGRILEGNFRFTAQNDNDLSLLKLTQGRFRLVVED